MRKFFKETVFTLLWEFIAGKSKNSCPKNFLSLCFFAYKKKAENEFSALTGILFLNDRKPGQSDLAAY